MTDRNDENDRMREKIRKLLTLAADPAAQGLEIDNALRFARVLMRQHNLTEADVKADAKPKDGHEIAAVAEATRYARESHFTSGSSLTSWENTLARVICRLVGTVQFYHGHAVRGERRNADGTLVFNPVSGRAVKSAQLVFYGPAEDVEAARVLMSEWTVTVIAMARLKCGGVLRGAGRSYADGFVEELSDRVYKITNEEYKKAKQLEEGGRLDIKRLASGTQEQKAIVLAERGSALAVADAQRQAEAKKERASLWLKEDVGIELVFNHGGTGGGEHHSGAYSQGRADGKKASGSLGYSRRPKLGSGS